MSKIYIIHKSLLWSSLPRDLANAAGGEPEHVLDQAISIGVQRHQLLLDKLLAALGAQARGHAAQATTVDRTENIFFKIFV